MLDPFWASGEEMIFQAFLDQKLIFHIWPWNWVYLKGFFILHPMEPFWGQYSHWFQRYCQSNLEFQKSLSTVKFLNFLQKYLFWGKRNIHFNFFQNWTVRFKDMAIFAKIYYNEIWKFWKFCFSLHQKFIWCHFMQISSIFKQNNFWTILDHFSCFGPYQKFWNTENLPLFPWFQKGITYFSTSQDARDIHRFNIQSVLIGKYTYEL